MGEIRIEPGALTGALPSGLAVRARFTLGK